MSEKRKSANKLKEKLPVHLGVGSKELIGTAIQAPVNDQQRALMRTFVAYAAPNVWGPKVTVASHIGSVTYTITYEAVGDTLVLGRVTYWKGPNGGKQVTEEFRDDTTITTSNSVANVECEFKGIPLGSAVNGTVSP